MQLVYEVRTKFEVIMFIFADSFGLPSINNGIQ